jgi:hypothetical protein
MCTDKIRSCLPGCRTDNLLNSDYVHLLQAPAGQTTSNQAGPVVDTAEDMELEFDDLDPCHHEAQLFIPFRYIPSGAEHQELLRHQPIDPTMQPPHSQAQPGAAPFAAHGCLTNMQQQKSAKLLCNSQGAPLI